MTKDTASVLSAIREVLSNLKDSLPSYPAAQQGALDNAIIAISAEVDVLSDLLGE